MPVPQRQPLREIQQNHQNGYQEQLQQDDQNDADLHVAPEREMLLLQQNEQQQRQHLQNGHQQQRPVPVRSRNYFCSICRASFYNPLELARHVEVKSNLCVCVCVCVCVYVGDLV